MYIKLYYIYYTTHTHTHTDIYLYVVVLININHVIRVLNTTVEQNIRI